MTATGRPRIYSAYRSGAVAQLGERHVRNVEVGSSILLGSTNEKPVARSGGLLTRALNALHIIIAEAEMVADLVDQDVADQMF